MSARMLSVGLPGFLALAPLVFAGCQHSCHHAGSAAGGTAVTASATPGSAVVPLGQPLLPAGTVGAALPEAAPAIADARPYGGQKTCPVMGEALGAMGPPVPVTVKGQTIYVCCKGCAKKVLNDPDAYLAKVAAERVGQ